MTSEDTVLAIKHGASAIWVSNHGGRQLDTAPSAIEVLPEITRAVKAASSGGGEERDRGVSRWRNHERY